MNAQDRAKAEAALRACEATLARNPNDWIAWHNKGVELRRLDRRAEALDAIERALSGGLRAPETLTMRAHLLGDHGRFEEAVDAYRKVLADYPDMIDAHETLARLLPQIGRQGEALHAYRSALSRAPGIGVLWVSAMAMARDLKDAEALAEWAQAAHARFGADTMITTYAAMAMSWQGDDRAAFETLQTAVAAEPDYVPAQQTLAHIAIRLGEMDIAEAAALAATRLAPQDQTAWALLSIIWRLTEDPREQWLADYEQFVMPIDLSGVDFATLVTSLERRHMTARHPAEQSLRGGTQTRGNLFDTVDPAIVALRVSIDRAIEWALTALPRDSGHPFLRRNTGAAEFAGSWSVRLRRAGFHISHIHPSGWLSSAAYISLPSDVDGTSDTGALAFGVPDADLGLALSPRRIIRPRVGQLVLFPSYMWHGTLPFDNDQSRLTVAFDALPMDTALSAR